MKNRTTFILITGFIIIIILPLSAFGNNREVSYALIITNNRSLDLNRPDLKYADDDGAKYAQLYSEFYGDSNVYLLTQFDKESEILFLKWKNRSKLPTKSNLSLVVNELASKIQINQNKDIFVNVQIIFAGHGDIKDGKGFVELEDGRFTATDLEELIIKKLPANRIHLILDSCNSYFMLNPRKPGGKRWVVKNDSTKSLLSKYPHVGAIISTSAEAVTYEWSELQSGIFSYELRSGLRGAADVNNDKMITYLEMAAFLSVSNKAVINDLYKPKVFSMGPGNDSSEKIVKLKQKTPRKLFIPKEKQRKFAFYDHRGFKLLDLNKEANTELSIYFPSDGKEIQIYETVKSESRPIVKLYSLSKLESININEIDFTSPQIVQRGQAPVFKSLFTVPFGLISYKEYVEDSKKEKSLIHYGVSKKDTDKLNYHLKTVASLERDSRINSGLLFTGLAATLGSVTPWITEDMKKMSRVFTSRFTYGLAGVMGVAGILALLYPADSESLYYEYSSMDFCTEKMRSNNLIGTELKLESIVNDWKNTRLLAGTVTAGIGILNLLSGIVNLTKKEADKNYSYMTIGTGAMAAGMGFHLLTKFRYPVERTWELYTNDKPIKYNSSTTDLLDSFSINLNFQSHDSLAPGLLLTGRF